MVDNEFRYERTRTFLLDYDTGPDDEYDNILIDKIIDYLINDKTTTEENLEDKIHQYMTQNNYKKY